MTSLYHSTIYEIFFWALFPNFFSVWLSWMCPWRETPTTDAAEILPVKVFLIINAGPPYWQNSRLPVDGRRISVTHCHELFSQNMLTQIHACTQTHMYEHTRVGSRKPTVGHMETSVLTYLIKYDRCTCTHTHNMPTNDAMHLVKRRPCAVFIM